MTSTHFNLRPVSTQSSGSHCSTSSSSSPPSDSKALPGSSRLPSSSSSTPNAGGANVGPRSRRPLSPSSLRDLDLGSPTSPSSSSSSSNLPSSRNERYASPPALTGHDLMAMFPPKAPTLIKARDPNGPGDAGANSTSGYFERQERAFFAQAGREIIRVKVDVDVNKGYGGSPDGGGGGHVIKTEHTAGLYTGPGGHGHNSHGAPPPSLVPLQPHAQQSAPPYPHSNRPHPHITTSPHYQTMGPNQANPISPSTPSSGHPGRLSQGFHSGSPVNPIGDSYLPPPHYPSHPSHPHPDEAYPPQPGPEDESWKTPTPFAERRRAGKHTRRVIVKS